jgi:hypothetical protein
VENDSLSQIICSGGLFLARDTHRFLFLLRTQGKTAGTWGMVGGKKEPDDLTAYDILTREIKEEVGKTPTIRKVVPLELFISNDQQFQYNTYVLLIDREFIPTLNEEHAGYAWCDFRQWPKPLHQGVKTSLSSRSISNKIEILLELI